MYVCVAVYVGACVAVDISVDGIVCVAIVTGIAVFVATGCTSVAVALGGSTITSVGRGVGFGL